MTEVFSETILRADGVSKVYARRSSAVRKRAARFIGPALFGLPSKENRELSAHEFWALKGISFELYRGEALGIIGLNGAGKTTLLRMLAGQILPDYGEITIRGTSAAMIDLQAGFQPAAPGRRNIFLRAAALGFTPSQTNAVLDEIVEFSELGDAIDAPMASYSSGMKMRLAFSIMAMVAPDVLFIDEVLAVGDFRFRQKCLAKIREMRERSAFVFVSHSMGDVSRFCDRVIVLNKGRVFFEGPPKEAIEVYESLNEDSPGASSSGALVKDMGPEFANPEAVADVVHYWCNQHGEAIDKAEFSDQLRFYVRFKATHDIRHLVIGVPVWNINAHYTTGLSTEVTHDCFEIKAGETTELMLEAQGGIINPGVIKSMFTILDGAEFLYRKPNADLEIRSAGHPTWGVVTVPHKWRKVEALAKTRHDKGLEV